ncbi:MAG TPA: DUF1236 domain-containing protein [Hyphomicrobiaceae bacterium]|jgi:hypothetical protein|nr:DUF1236 domain-containing protein [Hyphomicrobiaceae bacterium]
MKQKLLRTVSLCALIAAFSGAAVAQTGGAGGGGAPPGGSAPQAQQKMPDAGAGDAGRSTQSPGSGETAQPKSAQPKGGSGETRQPGSAQRDDSATPRKQDRSDTKSDQKRTPQASDGQRKDDGKRASDKGRDQDRTRTGQEQRGQDKDRVRTGQDKGDRGDRTRQGQADRGKDADRGTQLSEQQRTSVRERFTRSGVERNRVTNVNFDIRVGANVPRSVTLHTLPVDVVAVVPQYRGYRYVYVNDDIVIVNPATYAVVAVVSGGGSRAAGPRASRLTLAAPARAFVREHIDRGASIRLGIGAISIGMAIPQGVSLLPMPTVIVDRYPELGDYRYFVYEDDIAIVDPSSDEVVLIVAD